MSEIAVTMPLSLVDLEIFDAKGHLLARFWRKDVAELLLNRLNSQPDLLEACEWVFAEAEYRPPHYDNILNEEAYYAVSQTSFNKLQTAIAKAKN